MSALDTEAPAWETSKENAAPRKKGRDVAKLNRAFGAAPDDDAAIRHHEAALSTEGDDPLQAYATYAAYLEQHRPTDALAAFELRERCCRAFRDDERYKNDARYVQMWLDYADNLTDPDDLFKFMKKKKVGLTSAAFWCAWALRSEERGHVKNAAELYKKGLEKGAVPVEMLTAKQAAFEARAVERELEALRMLRASQIAEAQAAAGIRPSANGRDLITARERRRLQERHRRLKKNLANRERELTKLRKEQGGGKAGPSGASTAAGPAAPKINVKLSQPKGLKGPKGPSLKVKPVAKRAADDDLGGAPAKKQKQGGGPSERLRARPCGATSRGGVPP